MKHEVLLEDTCTKEQFLSLLYDQYPYDIEEKMVFTLLDKDTYPHPALLEFISYYADLPKYKVVKETENEDIHDLCVRMSTLYQMNTHALHTHVFQFDASLHIRPYKMKSPYAHLCLPQIPFLTQIDQQTLPVLTMESTYEDTRICRSHTFLFKDISIDAKDYLALSIRITEKHGIIYVPKTQIGVAIAIAAIYELVPPATDMDFILLYGLNTQEDMIAYYFDETNQIYTGLISGSKYHHFLYVMRMITTLYNAICIEKKDLPVHACMLEMKIHNERKGILFMGDDHTGKSELCDGLRTFCEQNSLDCSCIFEDSGTLHFLDNDISATGMQIGACVSIQGLPKSSLFQKLPVCAFLKHKQQITHILFPFTTHRETCRFHKVHALFYLNHHANSTGCRTIRDLEEAKRLFVQETPVQHDRKSSYFCNPLGCDQQRDEVANLIDQYFNVFMINDILLGEICTRYKKSRKPKALLELLLRDFLL